MNKVCVIGLGKMGLPIALSFTDAGFSVKGVDINSSLVDELNTGRTDLDEPGVKEKLEAALQNKLFTATTDIANAMNESSFVVVIVPLFLNKEKEPDYTAVLAVTEQVGKNLCRDQTISYETTLPPGTTLNKIRPILEEESGLKAGQDFGLVYSPERLMSKYAFQRIQELPKIVGAVGEIGRKKANEIYSKIYPKGVLNVSNPTTAELAKVTAGVYRDVQIAFANEIAKLCDEHNVNVLEVHDAVNSSPRRHMLLPGCGVGGHCIPVYPYFFLDGRKEMLPTILGSRQTNEDMPHYTVRLAKKSLNEKLHGAKITVLGFAYRPGIKETMMSPTWDIVNDLKKEGAVVSVYDSLFTPEEIKEKLGVESGELNELVNTADCIILVTAFDEFKNACENTKAVIIDGRNFLGHGKGIGC